MRTHIALRLIVSSALLAGMTPTHAFAQTPPDVTFELRPHCEETEPPAATPCPSYDVRDPLSKQTPAAKVGDVLDMDLVLHNPSALPIKRFRTWISYDSTALEGENLALGDAFPAATPGEMDFSIADNYIKLSGTAAQPITDDTIVLARIALTVKAAPSVGVMLVYFDPSGTATAHTAAFTGEGESEDNVASSVQGLLVVRMQGSSSATSSTPAIISSAASSIASTPPASSAASTPTETSSQMNSLAPISSAASSIASSATPAPTVFAKLQVQSLRVTTEGSSVFLAWNPLPSAELAGYNLYYGSISGRYLQRRSIDNASQTVTIRALPVGQTYYFAVRAVNGQGTESDFSQEVAVTVGNPATSTSPLSGALIEGGPNGNAPGTDGSISGESGPAIWFLLFAGISAVMGTLLAFRRQWTASSSISR